MDRIEEIKTMIESNSRTIKKLTLKIQELKEEIEKIDSRIKWIPASELDEEGYKKANKIVERWDIHGTPYAEKEAKSEQISELMGKREKLIKDLDYYAQEKEKLKQENINLRSELETLKKA